MAFAPDVNSLEAIIDAAFWASLRREEGYAPKISLAFLPPEQAIRPLMFERPLPLGAGVARPAWRPPSSAPAFTSASGRGTVSSRYGARRGRFPPYCFVLEVASPGLLVIKHHRGDISGKFVNVAVLEGDRLKIVDERRRACPTVRRC